MALKSDNDNVPTIRRANPAMNNNEEVALVLRKPILTIREELLEECWRSTVMKRGRGAIQNAREALIKSENEIVD